MFSKSKVTLLMALCLLSLVSIGFSSWNINNSPDDEILGDIMSDDIINSSEYVFLDTTKGRKNSEGKFTGMDWFDYEESGYLDSNGTYTDTGHIVTYYKIDREKCKDLFGKFNSLNIVLTLKYAYNNDTDLNIFASHSSTQLQNSGFREFSHETIINGFEYNETSGLNGRKFEINLVLIDFIEDYVSGTDEQFVTFSIDYSFFATTGPYFYDFLYRYLYGNNIEFAVDVKVSGINYVEVSNEN